jgi:hypothetical protein
VNKLKILAGAAAASFAITGCMMTEKPLEKAANDLGIGTSPYTNCSFEMTPNTEEIDIAIINGRVMDPECNFDGQRNVGIKGNRIVLITKGEIKAKRVIDVKGHVVAPGFINTHNHAFSPFDTKMMAHDGITTLLDTEAGVSNAKMFYDKYDGKAFVNYGSGIGHEEVRRVVLDGLSEEDTSDPTYILKARGLAQQDEHASWALDIPDPEQHQQILKMFEQGMCDGAIAVASTVGYMGYGTPTYEVFDLQKLAAKHDRYFGAHTRFGPTESLPTNYTLGVREVVANAVALDGKLIVSHIQNQNWQETYELTRRLQEKGMPIFAEYYPAITGNPNIATPQLLPDKIKNNNIDPTKHIFNPLTGELFKSEEEFFKMQRESPEMPIFIIVRDPTWLKEWPHMKDIVIASDAIAYYDENGELLPIDAPASAYGGHPRNASSNGIVFREAREQGIPLMDIVNNASYVAAKYLSLAGLKPMQERGRLQPGMIADITIFNPETIADAATMKIGERGLYTKGINYVIVSGEVSIDNGEANTTILAGQPIRYEVMSECNIPEIVDLKDKKYQWHSEMDGYPATRFPPRKQNPPSPNDLEAHQ